MDSAEFQDIITIAIDNEIEARTFYEGAAQKLPDPFLKSLFQQLAEEEERHRHILVKLLNTSPERFHFKTAPDYKVAETVDNLPELSTDMKPADAFAIAMKKEEEAMKHYESMARIMETEEYKNVFLELAAMEREHKFKMEKAFVDIGYPEVW